MDAGNNKIKSVNVFLTKVKCTIVVNYVNFRTKS